MRLPCLSSGEGVAGESLLTEGVCGRNEDGVECFLMSGFSFCLFAVAHREGENERVGYEGDGFVQAGKVMIDDA